MSIRTLVQTSADTGSVSSSTYSDPYWSNVSLLVNGDATDMDNNWSNVSLLLDGESVTSTYDPYWSNVSMLLTGDDFIDASNNANTVNNSSVTVNTSTKQYGNGSYYFSGSTYLSSNTNVANLNMGSGDFTVEMWIRFDSFTQYDRPFTLGYGGGPGGNGQYLYSEGLGIEVSSTGSTSALGAFCIGNGAGNTVYTPTLSTNTWYHLAFVRSGNNICIFTNGVPSTTASFSQAINFDSVSRLYLGGWSNAGSIQRYFKGYIDNIRITKGVARYSGIASIPTAALPTNSTDPNYSSVSLLITGDGTNGSQTFTDSSNSPVAITANGNVQINTTTKKYGTGSIAFDGSGDYLTISNATPFTLGTNDFTIEFWVYPTTLNAYAGVLCSAGNTGPYWTYYTGGWQINFGASSSVLGFAVSTSAGAYWGSSESSPLALNQWSHFAVTRSGLVIRKYINGVLDKTDTMPGNYTFSSDGTCFVGKHDIRGGMDFTGYLDDIRITKGVVRYNNNFTPDNIPVNTIIDRSSNPLSLTAYGSTQLSATTKYGSSSISLNGTNAYLTFPQTKTVTGTEDYTVECWVYLNSTTGSPAILGNSTTDGFQFGFNTTYNASGTSNGLRVGRTGTTNCENAAYQFLANTWYHVAVTRTASTTRFFVNGTLLTTTGTGTSTYSFPTTNTPFLGQYGNGTGYINGYIDDLRITKGVARYTSTFAAPSAKLPIPKLIDRSSNSLPLTLVGNAQLNASIKKFGNYSIAFDGAGDAVTFNSSPLLAFGTSDFTIECWYYHTGKSTSYPALYSNSTSWTTNTIAINVCHDLASTVFSVSIYNANSSALSLAGTTVIAANTWYHVALVRSDVNIRLFINGGLESTLVFTGSVDNGTSMPCYIGNDLVNSTSLNGYVDDFRITQGVGRYVRNFTPPTSTFFTYSDSSIDPYWDKVTLLLDGESTEVDAYFGNVSLLLKCDGLNGGTSFTDSSNNRVTITTNGSAQVSTGTKKYGIGSLYLPSSGSNYLSIADSTIFNLAGGPYTIECWIYPTGDYSNYNTIIAKRVLGGGTTAWELYLRISTGVLSFYNGTIYESTVTPTANTWSHVAGVYSGTHINLFLNGVNVYSVAVSNVDQSASIYIGTFTTYSEQFKGYIDDLRITKGVARYPAPFTLTSELPSTLNDDNSYSNVSLLLLGNGTNGSTTITDSSSASKTVTVFGNTQISTSTKKYGTGSIFFDGSGDYLTVPSGTDMLLNGVDFTMECWIYPTRAAGTGSMAGTGLIQSIMTQGEGWWTGGLQGNFLWHINNIGIQVSAITSGAVGLSAPFTMALNAWTHIAVTRVGTTMYGYVNGALVGSQKGCTDFGSSTSWTNYIGLGHFGDSKVANYFQGYIDDLRITKGVARYTANFTPPAATLPAPSILDTSANALTVLSSGSVSVNATTKKIGSSSIAFTGSSYMYYPGNTTIFNMGSLNWTVEAWVYLNAMPTSDAWPTSWSSHMVLIGVGSVNAADGFNCMIGQTKLLCQNNDVQYAGTAHGMVINTWYHVAFVRSSNILKFYVNGVPTGTVAFSGSIGVGANTYIGSETGQGAYFNGYIDNLRVTKGIARYNNTFTPLTATYPVKSGVVTDPYLSNVSLLLTAETTAVDANWSNVTLLLNGETLTDYSNTRSTVTANGNARIVNSVKKYGEGSIYFDGTGDYLTVANSSTVGLGSNDFTIECWFYQTGISAGVAVPHIYATNTWTTNGHALVPHHSLAPNKLSYYVYNANTTSYILASTSTVTNNTWIHAAVTRSGNTFRLFFNGVLEATTTYAGALDSGSTPIYIGTNTSSDSYFTGYMDDIRFTRGVARYTSTFTPPSSALPTIGMAIAGDANWSNVSLLLDGEPSTVGGDANWSNVALLIDGDTLTDKSNNALSLTAYGNATINTSIKKFGTGSMYFDGGGDRVAMTNSSVASFTGDFTIECWFYCNSYRTSQNWYYNYLWNSVDSSGGNWTYPYINAGVIYNGTLSVGYAGGTNSSMVSTSFGTSSAISMSTWYHLALVRSSGVISCYLNGVALPVTGGSSSNSSSISQTGLIIGDSRWNTGSESWDGYIDNFRITKDFARYTSAFTPPTITLPTSTYGPIGDKSPYSRTITTNGNTTTSTAQKKYGTGSMYFDGSGDYLSVDTSTGFAFGTGDFTIECWVYPTTAQTTDMFWVSAAGSGGLFFGTHNGGIGWGRAAVAWDYSSGVYLTLNVWSHVALVRNGTSMGVYVNGTIAGTLQTNSTSYDISTTSLNIGSQGANYYFTGYLDDVRITKGIARYTSVFTPPTAALPLPTGSETGDALWQNVSLLINADGAVDPYWNKVSFLLTGDNLIDSSTNHIAITNNNGVTVSTTTTKYGTGSLNMTGSDKYISFPASTSTNISTGDFTFECWINFNSFGTDRKYVLQWDSAGSYWQFVHDSGFGASLRVSGYSAIVNQGSNAGWTTGTWYHVALVRYGSTFTIYRNGVSIATGTSSAALGYFTVNPMYVGGNNIDAYFEDVRFTKGIARYTSAFTPPTAALVPTVLDKSANSIGVTPIDNVQLTSTVQYKYGIGSIYFDGSGDYLSIPYTTTYFDWWTTDYTLECWVYPITLASFNYYSSTYNVHISNMIGNSSPTADYCNWSFGPVATGAVALYYYNGSVVTPINSTLKINANEWSHIALTKTSSGIQIWVNGVGNGYTAISGTPQSNSGYPLLMGQYLGTNAYGYIDDLRITKGVARYTSTFTPPRTSLPILSVSDASPSVNTITSYGNTALNSSNKKFGANSLSFDGTGDYLTLPWSVMPTGTSDFTIEFWKYSNATRVGGILGFRASGSDNFQVYEGWPTAGEYLLLNDSTIQLGVNRTVPLNTWEHFAWVRSGNKFYYFINGSLQTTVTNSSSVSKSYTSFYLGEKLFSSASDFNGYIDELRITKGVARYTSDFVPQQLLTS